MFALIAAFVLFILDSKMLFAVVFGLVVMTVFMIIKGIWKNSTTNGQASYTWQGQQPTVFKNRNSVHASRTPYEFEQHCAKVLQDSGWRAAVTKASGDQGADVIADLGDMKVAVQCKQYTSRAVGNDAVQQIHTAKTIYGADHAVVVCSKPLFTKSAQEAAKACGVLLITENQLPNLSRLLRERQHQ